MRLLQVLHQLRNLCTKKSPAAPLAGPHSGIAPPAPGRSNSNAKTTSSPTKSFFAWLKRSPTTFRSCAERPGTPPARRNIDSRGMVWDDNWDDDWDEDLVDAQEGDGGWSYSTGTQQDYDPEEDFCECYCRGKAHSHGKK